LKNRISIILSKSKIMTYDIKNAPNRVGNVKLFLIQAFFVAVISLLCFLAIAAQTKSRPKPAQNTQNAAKFSGVYAGIQVIYGYNNTSLYTHCYYFRPDGTFATELEQPDWQTRVDGKFTVAGDKISAWENGEKEPDILEITDPATIQASGYVLGKFKVVNSIPADGFSRSSSASSGGNGTGVAYVGTSSSSDFVFDGKGNFSNNEGSSVAVIGSNVGGGGGNNSSFSGRYAIKDSVLTLNYPDGRTEVKSLFISDFSNPVVALINGSYFFGSDKPTAQTKVAPTPEPRKRPNPTVSKKESPVQKGFTGGVYAGVLFRPGINGMDSTTYTFYFRPDGTYAKEFDKPDWKSRVDGTYTLKGKTITLSEMEGGKPDTMEIDDDGSLDDGAYSLFKLNFMNSAPAKRLENKSASSMGGGVTGMVYVGRFSNNVFKFDGKGNFSNDESGTTSIIGDSIGGGASHDGKTFGTYTIKDSVLRLKYNDGTIVEKSFFYSETPEVMALIDGYFYYEYDEKDDEKTKPQVTEKPIDAAPDGRKILAAANTAQGGAKLDNLKTLRLKGNGMGLDITILVDVANQRIRNEIWSGGKLAAVEQVQGNAGWQWANNQKTPLTAKRIKELKRGFKTGILGLQSNLIKTASIQSAEIKEEGNVKTVIVEIDGEKYGMVFDANDYLVGEVSVSEDGKETTISKDFRKVDGIVFPFSSTATSELETVVINFTSVEVNPAFVENHWSVPN
jgi:hypothetical protein